MITGLLALVLVGAGLAFVVGASTSGKKLALLAVVLAVVATVIELAIAYLGRRA